MSVQRDARRMARRNPDQPSAGYAVRAGISGAVTVALVDGVLSRVIGLNSSAATRGALRLALGGALRYGLTRAGASPGIADGALVGPVLVTTLDVGVAVIGRRGIEPPPAESIEQAGLPWAPSPAWAVGAR